MGIDIVTYRARIGGFVVGRRMDSDIRVEGQENGMTKIWSFCLVVAVLLVIDGVEENPGPQVEWEN
jgi:hypothetical protein